MLGVVCKCVSSSAGQVEGPEINQGPQVSNEISIISHSCISMLGNVSYLLSKMYRLLNK